MDAWQAIDVLFNGISDISEQWEGDNERLWAMESFKDSSLGFIGPSTARSAGQHFTR